MKNITFPTTASPLFRPSERLSMLALLYERFTGRKRCKLRKSVYSEEEKKENGQIHQNAWETIWNTGLQFTEARDDARDASLLDLACPCTKKFYKNHS